MRPVWCIKLAVKQETLLQCVRGVQALGGDISHSRGAMLHMTLQLCSKLERAFERIVDGGKDGKGRKVNRREAEARRTGHGLSWVAKG